MRHIAIFICPECEAVDDDVNYNVNTCSTEYGTACINVSSDGTKSEYVDYNSSDYGDSDWDGSPAFECNECNNEMDQQEMAAAFHVFTITENDYHEYLHNGLSLEDIVKNKKNKARPGYQATKRPLEKPDCDSPTIVQKGTDTPGLTHGFRSFGMQCPRCEAIFARDDDGEDEHVCNECGHEFNITNLIETLCLK